MVDAKLGRVLLVVFKETNHATFISFSGVSLGKASPLFNVQTFFFVAVRYAFDSVYYLSFIEKRELVDWEQSWDVLHKVSQICMRIMLKTLGFF